MSDEDPHDFINRPRTRVRPDTVWDALQREIATGRVYKATVVDAFERAGSVALPPEVAAFIADCFRNKKKVPPGYFRDKAVLAKGPRPNEIEINGEVVQITGVKEAWSERGQAQQEAANLLKRYMAAGMAREEAEIEACQQAVKDKSLNADQLSSYMERDGWERWLNGAWMDEEPDMSSPQE